MALAWRLDDDATGRDAAKPLLQHGNVLHNAGTQLVVCLKALEVDFDRGLHAGSPGSRTPARWHKAGLVVLPMMDVNARAAFFGLRVKQRLGKAQEDAAAWSRGIAVRGLGEHMSSSKRSTR